MEHALDTVVNVGEGAGLLAISPHLKLLFGCDGLAEECNRGLPPALPGSVDVVEASNANVEGGICRQIRRRGTVLIMQNKHSLH